MLIIAQRYLEIHDRRVRKGGGFVISAQLERQAPGVKRWLGQPDYDRVLGGLSSNNAIVVVLLRLLFKYSSRTDERMGVMKNRQFVGGIETWGERVTGCTDVGRGGQPGFICCPKIAANRCVDAAASSGSLF